MDLHCRRSAVGGWGRPESGHRAALSAGTTIRAAPTASARPLLPTRAGLGGGPPATAAGTGPPSFPRQARHAVGCGLLVVTAHVEPLGSEVRWLPYRNRGPVGHPHPGSAYRRIPRNPGVPGSRRTTLLVDATTGHRPKRPLRVARARGKAHTDGFGRGARVGVAEQIASACGGAPEGSGAVVQPEHGGDGTQGAICSSRRSGLLQEADQRLGAAGRGRVQAAPVGQRRQGLGPGSPLGRLGAGARTRTRAAEPAGGGPRRAGARAPHALRGTSGRRRIGVGPDG